MTATALGTAVNANTLKRLILSEREEATKTAEILAGLREPVQQQIDALNKQFEDENFNLILQQREASEAAADYDRQLRELAVQHFTETGEKRLDADCSVRVNTKFEYDNAEAVEWAEKNAPVMIVKTVDKKAFESLPQTASLNFVRKTETATAVIAKEFTDVI